MRITRVICLILLSVFVALPVAASASSTAYDSSRVFFPSLHKADKAVYPIERIIGELADYDCDAAHEFLSKALASEFSLEWCEANINSDMRSPLVKIHSSLLSEILPASGFSMGRGMTNGDESVSIPVLLSDGRAVSFTVLENSIVSINLLN